MTNIENTTGIKIMAHMINILYEAYAPILFRSFFIFPGENENPLIPTEANTKIMITPAYEPISPEKGRIFRNPGPNAKPKKPANKLAGIKFFCKNLIFERISILSNISMLARVKSTNSVYNVINVSSFSDYNFR